VIVLLINPNRLNPRVPPIGLEYVHDAVIRAGHRVDLFDFGVQPPGKLRDHIQRTAPDIIGISIRNLDDVDLVRKREFVTPVKRLVRSVKLISSAKVVLGGTGFSIMPQELMEETGADYGIVGDGEQAFPALLDNLDHPERVPNLLYHAGTDSMIRQTDSRACPITELPVFQRSLIDYEKYRQTGGSCSIQTKRGCNHHCIYCPEPGISGRTIRCRPPELVVEELGILASFGVTDHLFFVDSEFNVQPDQATAVCEAICRSGLQISWCCSMTPLNVDRTLLQTMKEAGCTMVIWSVDSVSEQMLHRLGKGFSVLDVMTVTRYCDEIGVPYCLSLLFGGPGEDAHTIDETYRNIAENRAAFVAVSAGIRIYPKTALHTIAMDEGEISASTNLLYPVYYGHDRVKTELLPRIRKTFADMNNSVMYGRVPDAAVQKAINRIYPVYKNDSH